MFGKWTNKTVGGQKHNPRQRYSSARTVGPIADHVQGQSDKENVSPDDDGFVLPKKQQRKQQELLDKQALDQAYELQARVNTAGRGVDSNWRENRALTENARKLIQTNDARQVQRNYQRTQARRADQAHSRIGGKSTYIGRNGVKNAHADQLKTKDHGVLFSDQIPGLIVCHRDTFPLPLSSTKTMADKGVWRDRNGVLQEDKLRFFILRDRHASRVTELRILTHSDRGLAGVPQEEWCEYLNLKPFGATEYTPQNPKAPTLEIGYFSTRRKMDKKTMVVRLSDPVSRTFNCDELEKVGALTPQSLKILIDASKRLEGRNSLDE